MKSDEKQFWNEVVSAAETKVSSCFSATFFQDRNISIVDQQARCFNLCYALIKSKRVARTSKVAIVGAGISGMTCAVALAMATDALVFVFESDDMLLRRFRESPFRYFHPELNPNAGSRNGALSDDARLSTDFPLMNWTGGYGPELAEQLIRKFDHYCSISSIALYLKEEIVAVGSNDQRVQLRAKSGQSTLFDLAIVATGFGRERGLPLTRDDSYWHSGNPRDYRAIEVRRKRSPERVLISGNGDSAVIELAHFLIKDFRHQDIFSFLPLNLPLGRGYWYRASQDVLVHRKILSSIFFDEEDPRIPLAGGVLGWYWTMRGIAELNPRIPAHELLPTPMESRLFSIMHAQLGPHRRPCEVPAGVMHSVQKTTGARFEQLASEEIAEFARGIELTKIFDSGISKRMRRDVHITVVGPSPTIYSVRQAPLNWFLLAVLERFGSFEYHPGKLRRAATIVKNEIRTQYGAFDRVVARHGPKFDSLAYSLGREAHDIRALFLHEMVTDLGMDKKKSRWHDKVLECFRSKHWQRAQRQQKHFEDVRESDSPFASLVLARRHADFHLLDLMSTPFQAKAIHLYRNFKRESTIQRQSGVLVKLIRLTQQRNAATQATE